MSDVTQYEERLSHAAAAHVWAQGEAKRARKALNANVAVAHKGGVQLARIMQLCGWKQAKSVYDAIKAHNKAGGLPAGGAA